MFVPTTTPAVFVQTKLMCAGQWYLSSVMELRIAPDGKMSTIQCIGSAETFARRYQAIAILAVQPKGEDDDAHAAGGTDAPTEPKKARDPLPACPKCGKTTSVIVGRPEYGGGYVCFQKKEGCGHKWQPGHAAPADPQAAKDATRQAQSGEENQTQEPPKDPPPKVDQVYVALSNRLRALGCKDAHQAAAVVRFVCGQVDGKYEFNTMDSVKMTPGAPARVMMKIVDALKDGLPEAELYRDAMEQAGILTTAT